MTGQPPTSVSIICVCLALLALMSGCTRRHYRLRADADAYSILAQKSVGRPWALPRNYDLLPPPSSRLYDPSPLEDPALPLPAPQLYAYDLPPLRAGRRSGSGDVLAAEHGLAPEIDLPRVFRLARFDEPVKKGSFRQAAFQARRIDSGQASRATSGARSLRQPDDQTLALYSDELDIPPIPVDFWTALPRSCLTRMLEFESVRGEYQETRDDFRETHGQYPASMPPIEEYADPAPRLTLQDIMDQTLLNSREYQTQKELLYRVALDLSLQRFDYMLKPTVAANGTAANYDHTRVGGITENRLAVPTDAQVEKMLGIGGDVLARFANSVLLTFNGPNGFAADIGSDLLFDVSQSVLQRDILLEALTQAERNVVYATRDFSRFRKDLFRQQSSRYYNLLNTYRNIEIQSQNYFSFIRSFSEREVEYNYGLASRFDADQLELSILNGRNSLISTCNALEGALDNLKIQIGLPTETPINLDLTELNQLTLRDELAVTGELMRRMRRRLLSERSGDSPSTVLLLSYAIVLGERMLEAYDLQGRIEGRPPETGPLRLLVTQLRVDAGRLVVQQRQLELDEQQRATRQDPAVLFLRNMGLTEELLRLTARQIELAESRSLEPAQVEAIRARLAEVGQQAAELDQEFSDRLQQELERRENQAERETILEQLPRMVEQATVLRTAARRLVDSADQIIGAPEQDPEALLQQVNERSDELLRNADLLLAEIGSGLTPVELGVDDAMLTALVLRFDLINQRGFVADDWRAVKFAADDLKSVLNLRAAQRISTPGDLNRPFAFSFDDSQTSLDVTFDAPLNRRAQRNAFRQSLINYQASLRQLMQLEDTVKLSVRDDIRALALGRETYVISVASAALTRDSVLSNSLQLKLGVEGVSVRDFRESQDAFTRALIDVARNHISYINDRVQFFFDLELLTVDDEGFWPELHDQEFQPEPFFQLPDYALPAYGTLPPGVHHSPAIRRMNNVPLGTSAVHGARHADGPRESAENLEEIPPPSR